MDCDTDDKWCRAISDLVRATISEAEPKEGPAKLTDWGLYIGGLREAQDVESLRAHGIGAVVNAAPDVVHVVYPEDWKYIHVEAEDDEMYPLLDMHLEAVSEFLNEQRAQRRPVLLHCFAGMNRSAALCAAYLLVNDRMDLLAVVKLISERRGWILSNDGFVQQLVQLAKTEKLLKPSARLQLDVVHEESDKHSKSSCSKRAASEHCHASKLGRSLSRMSSFSSDGPGDGPGTLQRTGGPDGRLVRKLSKSSSALSDISTDGSEMKVPRTSSYQPLQARTISDKELGYASRLPRQDSVGPEVKKIRPIQDVREGRAGLKNGTYLYVVMLGDQEHIRLIHEDHLVHEGVLAGHTSLVQRGEFTRGWAKQWDTNDPQFRHTVLYAGELEYEEGDGVVMWNNHSGHYTPSAADHVRVHLDPATFVAFND
ncbi:Dusp2 [Symbiodinium natans]|uniref:protein-tyrosine-phosphatase n=1 Tax=Symbiodinium natans TaxID=878477 RepID=A0A812Q0Q6_9DINO|nr:Dusp2 [Symbiodinium natans]